MPVALELTLSSALLLALAAPPLVAQRGAEADGAAGQALYQKYCTACHGGNAQGGHGPNLTSGPWRWGGSDAEILRNIFRVPVPKV